MNLSNLKPAEGSIKHSKRIGRGAGRELREKQFMKIVSLAPEVL